MYILIHIILIHINIYIYINIKNIEKVNFIKITLIHGNESYLFHNIYRILLS